MRKEIVFLLVAAVLLLGGVAAVFENLGVSTHWKLPKVDPESPDLGIILVPNGDPLPPAPG